MLKSGGEYCTNRVFTMLKNNDKKVDEYTL